MTAAAAFGVARTIKTVVVILPEKPPGVNMQALENRLRVAVERAGRSIIGIHYCGEGAPTLLKAKLLRADECIIYSPQMERFEIVPAAVLARLLGDRVI
jgi:hypothetical protein